ncbi:AN1-type zinc finger protein 2B [Trichinella pseudospiralis]|uniref:AN1-type zinc finger protein 2B n=1 Tax=Trichinella pseudospiralis TaxID=6337 RepID=A0A0V0Y5T1_TRIPS|nr:AN1-type zinc finger protein 2B [Trichinella pseudospiralis]
MKTHFCRKEELVDDVYYRMEFPNLDFLPIKCDECSQLFCKDHYEYSRHACPFAGRKDYCLPVCPLCSQSVSCPRDFPPDVAVSEHIDRDCQSDPALAKRKIYVNKCSVKNCKQRELVPVECPKCHKNFCFKHRHNADHECSQSSSNSTSALSLSKISCNLFGFKTRKRETSDKDLRSMNGMVCIFSIIHFTAGIDFVFQDEGQAIEEAIRRSIADSVQSSTSNEKSTSDIEQRNQRTNQNSAYGNCLIS